VPSPAIRTVAPPALSECWTSWAAAIVGIASTINRCALGRPIEPLGPADPHVRHPRGRRPPNQTSRSPHLRSPCGVFRKLPRAYRAIQKDQGAQATRASPRPISIQLGASRERPSNTRCPVLPVLGARWSQLVAFRSSTSARRFNARLSMLVHSLRQLFANAAMAASHVAAYAWVGVRSS
jgi:hypothetical protein